MNIPQDTYVETINDISPVDGDVVLNATDIPVVGVAVKSVSGNPVSITDAVESDAVDLKVTISPHQELNGYDSPWISTEVDKTPYNFRASSESIVSDLGTHELDTIIGGTVAWNQLATTSFSTSTIDGITFTNNQDGTWTASGTATADAIRAIAVGLYPPYGHLVLLHGCPKGGSASSYYMDCGTTKKDTGEGMLLRCNDTLPVRIVIKNGTTVNNLLFTPQATDITAMLGTTIADYVYSLETATAGAGVAWLKKHFPKMFTYHAYDAGSLVSVEGLSHHVTTGFNQFNLANYAKIDGGYFDYNKIVSGSGRLVVYIPCLPNTTYCASRKAVFTGERFAIAWTKELPAVGVEIFGGMQAPNTQTVGNVMSITATTGDDAKYIVVWAYWGDSTEALDTLCINLSDPAKNGTYEPYVEHTYPLDGTKSFKGIFKLDSNNRLYADGDVYKPDGTVVRRYGKRTINGSLSFTSFATRTNTVRAFLPVPSMRPNNTNNPDVISTVPLHAPDYVYNNDVEGISENKHATDAGLWVSVAKSKLSAETLDGLKAYLTSNPFDVVYPSATPTTESADPYTSAQVIDAEGSEDISCPSWT